MHTPDSSNGCQITRAILSLILLATVSVVAYCTGANKAGKIRDAAVQKTEDEWRSQLINVEKNFAPLMESQDEHIILGVIKNQKRLTLILSTPKGDAIVRRLNSDRILSKPHEFVLGSKMIFDPVSKCYRAVAPSVIPMPKPYNPQLSSQK